MRKESGALFKKVLFSDSLPICLLLLRIFFFIGESSDAKRCQNSWPISQGKESDSL